MKHEKKISMLLSAVILLSQASGVLADGSYPLSNNTYVVIRKDEPENSKARRFADFMLSPTGQQCVAMAGFGPLNPVE